MGSSHNAFCAADLLLRYLQSGALERASILVLSGSTPRPFYVSKQAAQPDGYYTSDVADV